MIITSDFPRNRDFLFSVLAALLMLASPSSAQAFPPISVINTTLTATSYYNRSGVYCGDGSAFGSHVIAGITTEDVCVQACYTAGPANCESASFAGAQCALFPPQTCVLYGWTVSPANLYTRTPLPEDYWPVHDMYCGDSGGFYNGLTNATDIKTCLFYCQADPTCTAISWVPTAASGQADKCALFTSARPCVEYGYPQSTIFYKPTVANWLLTSAQYCGSGPIYNNHLVNNADAESSAIRCAHLCSVNPNCTASSWTRTGGTNKCAHSTVDSPCEKYGWTIGPAHILERPPNPPGPTPGPTGAPTPPAPNAAVPPAATGRLLYSLVASAIATAMLAVAGFY